MKKPTKADKNRLVKSYSIQRAAKLQNVPIKIQQRLHDAFNAQLEAFFKKYEEYLGKYPHPEFFDALERAAVKYNQNRTMSGAGVDW